MAKILITGSNGLLGQKLSLLAPGLSHTILATSFGENRNPALQHSNNYRPLDICDPKEVERIVKEFRPDYLINTAAMTNVDDCETKKEECHALNVKAVGNLLDACSEFDCRLIHLSTDFVFDGLNGPYQETDIPNPISNYGRLKNEAEKLILSSNRPHAIARTILVYGIVHNMSRSNIVLWVKDSLEKGKKINVVNDQWRTPTLAEDLALGCLKIVGKAAVGIYHISGDEMMTPFEMAIRIADFFGLDKTLIQESDGLKFVQTANRPPKTGFNISKARIDLDYNPRSFEEGLKITRDLFLKFNP